MRRSPTQFWLILLCALVIACGDDGRSPARDAGSGAGADAAGGDAGPGDPEVFPGLRAEVEILIDDRGIPHIYAENDADLFYATGYQLATDRLFQIDLLRRRALGRSAEVLGAAKLDEDKISRLFNFKRWGALDAERFKREQPTDYALFSAWVAGINQRIDEVNRGEQPLPYGFGPEQADYRPEPWRNVDPFVIAKMIAFANSNVLEFEFLNTVVKRLTPAAYAAIDILEPGAAAFCVPPEDRPSASSTKARTSEPAARASAAPAEVAEKLRAMHRALAGFRVSGSNNWAIDGRFTDNGKPLIANDPHQPLQSPSVMYAMHMNSADRGGSVDVAGFGFAGAPGVQLGHNRHVQWAATTGFADCMDLFSVSVDGDTINAGGTRAPITRRSEEISVKGEGPFLLEVRDVDGYGVLLGDALPFPELLAVDVGRNLLINWTGFRATNEAAASFGMGRARSLREWEQAVDKMEVGTFNWLGADENGISYHVHTLVPDRGDPAARQMPYLAVDGDDPASYWTGDYLAPDKLPRSHAPETGFVATANNDPLGFTADGDVHNDPWYYGAFFDPGYRAARLEQRLTALRDRGAVSVEDMQTLQLDTHSVLADQLLPVLAEVVGRVPSDPALASFRDRPELASLARLLTVDWDHSMQREQAGALAFHVFAHFLATQIYRDDLAVTFASIIDASANTLLKFSAQAVRGQFANGNAVMAEGRDVLVMRALADAAAWLTAQFGAVSPASYSWGQRHGSGFRNPIGGALDQGWFPTHGGEDTVNVSASTFYKRDTTDVVERFESNDGAVFRVVTRFLDDGTPEASVNFPPGNSGDPESPHFSDTLEDWREGVYRKLPFTRAEVEAAQSDRLVLRP
jgi:penicillin amidase